MLEGVLPAVMFFVKLRKGRWRLLLLIGDPTENTGVGYCPSKEKSGWLFIRNFFLGCSVGTKLERCIGFRFDTISTNHGFIRFTFCSKSGSSHDTYDDDE